MLRANMADFGRIAFSCLQCRELICTYDGLLNVLPAACILTWGCGSDVTAEGLYNGANRLREHEGIETRSSKLKL